MGWVWGMILAWKVKWSGGIFVLAESLKYKLSGTYFTDRKTVGRIRLRQIGHDANVDVSFY